MPKDPHGELFKVLAVTEAFGAFACITDPDKGLLMLSEHVERGDNVRVFFQGGMWEQYLHNDAPREPEEKGELREPDHERVPEELPSPVRPARKHP
jgi:hypothetical protein